MVAAASAARALTPSWFEVLLPPGERIIVFKALLKAWRARAPLRSLRRHPYGQPFEAIIEDIDEFSAIWARKLTRQEAPPRPGREHDFYGYRRIKAEGGMSTASWSLTRRARPIAARAFNEVLRQGPMRLCAWITDGIPGPGRRLSTTRSTTC